MHLSAPLCALCALALGCTHATRSVCVLPYEVISADPRCEYLSEAIPEFLTNELSRTPMIEVQDPQEGTCASRRCAAGGRCETTRGSTRWGASWGRTTLSWGR